MNKKQKYNQERKWIKFYLIKFNQAGMKCESSVLRKLEERLIVCNRKLA